MALCCACFSRVGAVSPTKAVLWYTPGSRHSTGFPSLCTSLLDGWLAAFTEPGCVRLRGFRRNLTYKFGCAASSVNRTLIVFSRAVSCFAAACSRRLLTINLPTVLQVARTALLGQALHLARARRVVVLCMLRWVQQTRVATLQGVTNTRRRYCTAACRLWVRWPVLSSCSFTGWYPNRRQRCRAA